MFQSLFKNLKEPFCSISHGLGVLLSLAGLVALLIFVHGKGWHLLAFSVYGISLITLYIASTLYHSLRVPPRIENRLARFDYCAIYFLIAGSYTPICVLALGGAVGWTLLGAVWTLAIVGILACIFWKDNPDWLRMTLYLVMGWLVVFAFSPLREALPAAAIRWLIAGGVAYSIGAIILAIDRPHLWPGKFSAHDLWHIFVLGGSACHFVMMTQFIVPLPHPAV